MGEDFFRHPYFQKQDNYFSFPDKNTQLSQLLEKSHQLHLEIKTKPVKKKGSATRIFLVNFRKFSKLLFNEKLETTVVTLCVYNNSHR